MRGFRAAMRYYGDLHAGDHILGDGSMWLINIALVPRFCRRCEWITQSIGSRHIFRRYSNYMIALTLRRNSCAAVRHTGAPIVLPAPPRPPFALRGSTRSPDDGGWSFAFDPDHPAAHAPALWQPQACAHVAIAEPSSDGFAALRLADFIGSAEIAAELILHRDWHLVIVAGGRRYRLWLRRFRGDEPLAYVNPADPHHALRSEVSHALQRQASGRLPARHFAREGAAGPSEHWRLIQWLRLLDAAAEGRSARDIAAALILDDARDFSAAAWDASSERRRIARWQRAAIAMRDGGYRRLLGAA